MCLVIPISLESEAKIGKLLSQGYSANSAIEWCVVKYKDNDAGYTELKYLMSKGYSLDQSVKLQRAACYYDSMNVRYLHY